MNKKGDIIEYLPLIMILIGIILFIVLILPVLIDTSKCTIYCESNNETFGYVDRDYCVCRSPPFGGVKLKDIK